MLRNKLYLTKGTHCEHLQSSKDKAWCVYSNQGTFITELSHQGKQNRKTTSSFSFSVHTHVSKS